MLVPEPLRKRAHSTASFLRYAGQQLGMFAPSFVGQRAIALLTKRYKPADPAVQRALFERLRRLFAQDIRNVRDHIYPEALLTQVPLKEYGKALPRFLWDLPKVLRRRDERAHDDLPQDANAYPSYFRRTFHWQSDGYLSDKSADIYDLSVEFLFLGTADMMRRQIIAPIKRWHLKQSQQSQPFRMLDIACGTGRTLSQVGHAFPEAHFQAVDLSPHYAEKARKNCRHIESLEVFVENAEQLTMPDVSQDVVFSVYLFHELPKAARRQILKEIFRVLRPGGLVVIEDSAQSDAHDIAPVLQRFPEDFHEPFYKDYMNDDLDELLKASGFQIVEASDAFVSKVVAAIKPNLEVQP